MTYLEEHPPIRSQCIKQRRAKVTGAIVVHTAENTTDIVLPDDGAEAVARFISRRSTAGSYHSIVDSDSILRLMPYEWEAFHEGSGGNRWSLGLSFACQASQWPTLPLKWIYGALDHGAQEAVNMAQWVQKTVGVTVPAERISAAEYRSGKPGFISHAELDPKRRYDPGPLFLWNRFLDRFIELQGSIMPTMQSILSVRELRETIETLYLIHRGSLELINHHEEIDHWMRHITPGFLKGEDVGSTLQYIEFLLASEPKA